MHQRRLGYAAQALTDWVIRSSLSLAIGEYDRVRLSRARVGGLRLAAGSRIVLAVAVVVGEVDGVVTRLR